MGYRDYSTTAADNTSLFPEDMAPSAVNNGMRQVQADIAQYISDMQRGCLLYKSGNQSIANGVGSLTDVTWDSETYDTDSFHSTSTNTNRITIPAGVSKIEVSACILWGSSGTGDRIVGIQKNAANFRGGPQEIDPAASIVMTMSVRSCVVDVVEGDYFTVVVGQSSGGALNVTADERTWFALKVIA